MACKFYLEFVNLEEGTLYEIDEPTNWGDITLNMDTPDPLLFGRNWTFSKGEVPLLFEDNYDTKVLGHQFEKLIEYYRYFGQASCVRFYFNQCDGNLLLGELNYEGVTTDGCQDFEVNIKQSQTSNTVLEQLETNANLKSTTTLNGEVCPTMPTDTFCLQSKEIQSKAEQSIFGDAHYDVSSTVNWSSTENGIKRGTNHIFNLNSINDADIENNLYALDGNEVIPSDKFSFKFDENFSIINIDFNLAFDYVFAAKLTGGVPNTNFSEERVRLVIEHRNVDGTILDQEIVYEDTSNFNYAGLILSDFATTSANDDAIQDSDFTQRNVSFSKTYTNVPKDSHLIAYYFWEANPANSASTKKLRSWLRVFKTGSNFEVNGLSIAEDTEHEIPRLHEMIKKQVSYITDNTVQVSMPEFEEGGEFYNYWVANGYEVRQDGDIQERQFSYDLERSINSLNAIFAAGYQVFGNTIYIGTVKQFYKNIDMGLMDYPVINYSEQFKKDLLNNLFQFEYKETPKDENNTIDEFNTSAEYALPVDKVKGKIPVKSDFVGSGYLLEQERRKKFANKPTESSDLDDEVFIINGIYSNALGKFINRTTENISNIANVISPQTSYNIAINPLQNFARWYCYVGSGAHFVNKSSKVTVTDFESNEFFQSQVLDSSALNAINVQKDIYEKTFFPVPIFEPIEINVTFSNVLMSDVLTLRSELFLSRGYKRVKNYKGEEQEIFITSFEYSPSEEKLDVTGTKRSYTHNIPATGVDELFLSSSSELSSTSELSSSITI